METPCVRWEGRYRESDGRPMWDGQRLAYRVLWEQEYGSVPPILHHRCLNGWCVNLAHLVPLTDDVEHGKEHGGKVGEWHAAKTHCPQGHEYNEVNTRYYERNRRGKVVIERACRLCQNAHHRRYRSKS